MTQWTRRLCQLTQGIESSMGTRVFQIRISSYSDTQYIYMGGADR